MGESVRRWRRSFGESDFAVSTWKQQAWMKRSAVVTFFFFMVNYNCWMKRSAVVTFFFFMVNYNCYFMVTMIT